MAAIDLGRLKVTTATAVLASPKLAATLGESGRWAVAQFQGRPYVPAPPIVGHTTGYFLEPAP
jgi:hypothetical protein